MAGSSMNSNMTKDHVMAGVKRRAEDSHIACVVPMFNEGGHAQRFLFELNQRMAGRFREVTIIAIDDGSEDSTADEVRGAIQQGIPVRLTRLSRNFGKEIALTAGLEAAEKLRNP